jgi:hypothetical protein
VHKTTVVFCVSGLLLAAGFLYAVGDRRDTAVVRELHRLTGAETRMVWCRQVTGIGYDALGSQLALMGIATSERAGERQLLRRVGSYWKPMISPRGDRVVFTDFPAATVYAVNWDGSSLRELGAGYALNVWLDPVTAREWVYAVETREGKAYAGRPLVRFQLDNPFDRERVWDAAPVHFDNLRVSPDGTKAGGLFPWPDAGIADLASGTWSRYGRGCWPDLSPDQTCIPWVFDGAHRNLLFRSADGSNRWKVAINDAPGVDGKEVDCPRWSNLVRFMTMTGPHERKKPKDRKERGEPEEIYAGRFDSGLTRIEHWVRVTHNDRADFFSDIWVEPRGEAGRTRGRAAAHGAGERLVVQARLAEITMTPTLESIAPYRQALVVYAYDVERVAHGHYRPARILVAHWGLVQGKPRDTGKARGMSYQLTVAPLDDQRELEGERVVMDMKSDGLPVYVEVSL